MPKKTKNYVNVRFTPEVIKEARDLIKTMAPNPKMPIDYESFFIRPSRSEEWTHDNEDEFFSDYRKEFIMARCGFHYHGTELSLHVGATESSVTIFMLKRAGVEKAFNVFDSNVEKCSIPIELPKKPKKQKKQKPKIFIGHGHDLQWRDLKDHLRDKHRYDVESYESGARTGLTVVEVLNDMLANSSFAILVLTGEDIDAVGGLHARENVIHELGLFQGRLGWRRAIIILEEGVGEFSNIHGVNQIRFRRSNIKETFGEVLATIKREFP